jgi:RNA polymerase sigma-70 factor (sigma-E family)
VCVADEDRGVRVVEDDAASDRARLAALFVSDYDKLVRLARLLGDHADAEDVVQTAFVRVYRRGRLREPELAGAYLRQAVVNLIRSSWRRKQTARRHAQVGAPEEVPESDIAGRLVMREAIAALPRRQREAVVLRYYADLTEATTAEVMGVSVGSVKAYTSRGLARLGELLAGSAR